MKKIEFTKDQYKQLLKLVYLGNWVVNGHRHPNEAVEECEELENYVFSKAKEFDAVHFVDISPEGTFPSETFEDDEDLQEYLDHYNGENFWKQFITHMAIKKLYSLFTKEEIKKMDEEEVFELISRFEEQYAKEFERNYLDNVQINMETSAAVKIPFNEKD